LEEGSADLGLLLLDKGKQRLLGFRLGMQLKAEKDAKFELVLETWVRLKLLFGSIVRFCARLTRLKLISCWIKKL